MKLKKEATEYDLLSVFVTEMEKRGETKNTVYLDINEAMANSVGGSLSIDSNIQKLEQLADKCLANEWIQRNSIGNQYGSLSITSTGVGVVRSKQRKQEALKRRSILKKISDYIEDHKGLFTAIGALVAIVGLFFSVKK